MFEKTKPQDRHAYRAALMASSRLADVDGAKILLQAIEENGWSLDCCDLNYAILAALNAKQYEQAAID